MGRRVRVVRRSLAVANGDISTLSPWGRPLNDHFRCSAWEPSCQALFLEVMGENTDQRCSTLSLLQCGQNVNTQNLPAPANKLRKLVAKSR